MSTERISRYQDADESWRRGWGKKALAVVDEEGTRLEFYAEGADTGQLFEAWPDFLEVPARKAVHHQTLYNWSKHDRVFFEVVDWDETTFSEEMVLV